MAKKIDLKEIERRTYLFYHQDGLMDIAVGAFVFVFSLMNLIGNAWLAGAVVGGVTPMIVIFWGHAKIKITAPRIGYVKFAPARTRRMQFAKIMVALFVLGSLALLIGISSFVETEHINPSWWLFLVENAMIVVGMLGAALAGAVAFSTGIRRFYVYALINLVLFVGGQLVSAPSQYVVNSVCVVIVMGVLIMASGVVLLNRFVSNYPLSGVGSNAKH
jgi:hypothetical protein